MKFCKRNNRSEQVALMSQIVERSQKILADFAGKQGGANANGQSQDPLNLAPMVLELATRMLANPGDHFPGTAVALAKLHRPLAKYQQTACSARKPTR